MKTFWLRMWYWREWGGFSSVRSRMPAGRCAMRSIALSMAESSSVGVRREHSALAEPLPNGQLAAAGGAVTGGAEGLVDGVGVEGELLPPQRSAKATARTQAAPRRTSENILPATLSRAPESTPLRPSPLPERCLLTGTRSGKLEGGRVFGKAGQCLGVISRLSEPDCCFWRR